MDLSFKIDMPIDGSLRQTRLRYDEIYDNTTIRNAIDPGSEELDGTSYTYTDGNDLLNQLRAVLLSYLVTAGDWNQIQEEFNGLLESLPVDVALNQTTPTVSTSETIVNSPITLTIKGNTEVVSGNLIPTRGVQVNSVNGNLSPLKNWVQGNLSTSTGAEVPTSIRLRSEFITIEELTQYASYIDSSYVIDGYYLYDEDETFQSRLTTTPFTSIVNTELLRITIRRSDNGVILANEINDSDLTLVEGSDSPTAHISHASSTWVSPFDLVLGGVPNGTKDKLEIDLDADGECIYTANTNVGRDGNFRTINESDSITIFTLQTNTNVIIIPLSKLIGVSPQTNTDVNHSVSTSKNTTEVTNSGSNELSNINNFYTTSAQLAFIVDKTINTQQLAEDYATGIELCYQLATPITRTLEITDKPIAYADYTQFRLDSGVVVGELARCLPSNTGNTHAINTLMATAEPDSQLKYQTDEIIDILFDGKSIISLGTITSNFAFGNERWQVQTSVLEENNIDVNQIYVTYKVTSEDDNGQASASIVIENALAKVVNNLTKSHKVTSEQLDVITSRFNLSAGSLGLLSVSDFSSTQGGLTSWTNPVGITRVEIYQSEFNLKNYNYQQLNNEDGITKYNASTGTSQQLTVSSITLYYTVAATIYTIGGKEYVILSPVVQFTTANELILLDAPSNPGLFIAIAGGTLRIDANGLAIWDTSVNPPENQVAGTTNQQSMAPYSTLEVSFSATIPTTSVGILTVVRDTQDTSGNALISQGTNFSSTGTQTIEFDISSINSGYVQFSGTGGAPTNTIALVTEVKLR